MTREELRDAVALARDWKAWTNWLKLSPVERIAGGEAIIPKLDERFDEVSTNEAINIIATALLQVVDCEKP